jgi:hypothetical protein
MRQVDVKRPNLLDVAQQAAERVTAPAPALVAPVLTPRVVTIRVTARNPETGLMQVVELRSTVMDASDRARKASVVAALAQGTPLGLMHPIDAHALDAMARLIVQCGGLPAELQWLIAGPTHVPEVPPVDGLPDISPLGNLLLIEEALLEHERRYFLGDGSTASSRALSTRVEKPWTVSSQPAGDSTGGG